MTKEDIIRMAREAGVEDSNEYNHLVCTEVELVAFARLVAEHERELCANICEEESGYKTAFCALKIRARGQE